MKLWKNLKKNSENGLSASKLVVSSENTALNFQKQSNQRYNPKNLNYN